MASLLLALCVVADVAAVDAQTGWAHFVSPAGFTVSYPASWRQLAGASGTGITIMSSRAFAEGVGIAHGEAMISVIERNDSTHIGLDALVQRDRGDDSVLVQRRLAAPRGSTGSCRQLTEVVLRSEMGPDTYEIDTDLYCEVHGRIFRISLRNWEDDKHQAGYQSTARRVAWSLRIP